MDDHHHMILQTIELFKILDKNHTYTLSFRDITFGASDDLNCVTHLGMKY